MIVIKSATGLPHNNSPTKKEKKNYHNWSVTKPAYDCSIYVQDLYCYIVKEIVLTFLLIQLL